MDREKEYRRQLRARAWDALAALPEGLSLPIEVVQPDEDGVVEAVVTVRRRAEPCPGPPAVSLTKQQRFLRGCWLTDAEREIVEALLEGDNRRRTQAELRDLVRPRLARPPSEGVLKGLLARMTDAAVAILENDRTARPPGYRVTRRYLTFLGWAARNAPEQAEQAGPGEVA